MNAASITTSDLCGQFLHHLAAQPDAPAVISHDGVISFRSMGRMIAAAQQIITAARPRTVGLYFAPSPALVAAAWGALFSGVAYVPLAPTYPEDRIRYMTGAGDVDLILTPAELRGDLEEIVAGTGVSIAEIPAAAGIPAAGGGGTPRDTAAPDAIAFVLYTSGSTGAPKGVEIPQTSLAHQMRWISSGLDLGPGARIVHKTPISFDAAQWEFLANATGAAVVVGDPDLYRDPEALIDAVTTHQVTHLQVVPTLLQALCEEPALSACTSLRLVASGGESLSSRLGATAVGMLPAARIVNVYGPTETTINSSFYPLPRPLEGPPPAAGVVPIGLPVDGLAFHLLDEAGEPTDSATGEIGISGLQLARGYRNRPEETDRRFVTRVINGTPTRLYRTGDAGELIDGIFHFRGRTDSQVKIRGHRIELDEIRNALENHEWVRHAGVFTVDRGNDDAPRLVAHIELNPHEAAVLDQGVHHTPAVFDQGVHHTHVQAAEPGPWKDHPTPAIALPLSPEDDLLLRRTAFGQTPYRAFHSAETDPQLLAQLTALVQTPRELPGPHTGGWSMPSLAFVLRSLLQYRSESRPPRGYAYAPAGALYGVHVYVRIAGLPTVADGMYYLNPRSATLHFVHAAPADDHRPGAGLVLVGRRSVISPLSMADADEVLHLEAGHLLGLLDTIAPATGHRVGDRNDTSAADLALIGTDPGDRFVIGSWPLTEAGSADPLPAVRCHLDILGGAPGHRGVYESNGSVLTRVSTDPLIRRQDVIAVDRRVYDKASFGLVLTSTGSPESYIDLGRALQRVRMNDRNLGLMISGHSSFSNHEPATARRIRSFTGSQGESSCFALGGPVTDGQTAHDATDEDVLHTQELADIITTDIAGMLPHYMLPDVIRICDDLPRTPSGKIDIRALHEAELVRAGHPDEDTYTAPATPLERQLAHVWQESLHHDSPLSTTTSFFTLGGNSIAAVRLVKNIRARFGVPLPVQAIFEHDTIAKQARALSAENTAAFSRAVPLAGKGDSPVFLWPGLGGYPMNLRALAESTAGTSYTCYGLQAHGLNDGEDTKDDTIVVMARRDIEQVRRIQPHGPYNLIGYSFGARIAFEVAHQLETQGETVDRVILLAPGSPSIQQEPATPGADGRYRETWFKRLLFSVFFGRTDGPLADSVAATVTGRDSFLKAVASGLEIDTSLADRITRLVEKTCEFQYTFTELADRNLAAAITIIRAAGDDYSFLDTAATDVSHTSGTLNADHYQILRTPHVEHTANTVIAALTQPTTTKLPKDNPRTPHATLGRV
ncbi:amino acid adenylation domain-containing protein [Streptomyces microflavus]|uniref:non-ribosomal peptide synthetase family protein n=1 Tax=Streptomyces microflavus TaxID=1919 RepID=UPI0033DE02C0